jgi:hypothetical protein
MKAERFCLPLLWGLVWGVSGAEVVVTSAGVWVELGRGFALGRCSGCELFYISQLDRGKADRFKSSHLVHVPLSDGSSNNQAERQAIF